MPTNLELRSFGEKLELRSVKRDGFLDKGVQGYAVVYGVESRDMGGWREIIARGAVKESLGKNLDVRFLYQHDMRQVMARESAGTLVLREDNKGLYFEADLVDTTLNRDALANIRAGNLNEMSFGMPIGSIVAKWERSESGKYDVRTVTKADVAEVSVVTKAAYGETSVDAQRDYQSFLDSVRVQSTPVETLRTRLELAKRKYRN